MTDARFRSASKEEVEVRAQVSNGLELNRHVTIYLNGFKEATYCMYEEDNRASEELPYVDYNKALGRIRQCSTHENCPPIEETYLPTRVIDCSNPSKPRLFETHRQIKGYYCALSYVWGGEQQQKTTMSVIDTYIRDGINVPLPQTIADAILVTNKLGIRYLWVDALCIIQDSIEDKNNELGIMGHIYRDAYLTISVLSAFRADQGFLPDERPSDVLPFYPVDSSLPPRRMLLRYIMPRPRSISGSRSNPEVILHNPLDDRAWCLQESRLSPRRLMFCTPYVSYKCPSFYALDVSHPPRFRSHNPPRAKDLFLFQTNRALASTEVSTDEVCKKLRDSWQMLLLDYSKRSMTVPSDKFVAVASIAEALQPLLNDQYIAGLWKGNFIGDLLWAIRPPTGPNEGHLPRPVNYRAPTWSWASVDGNLTRNPHPLASESCYEAEIISCEVAPKVKTFPFGEITDAKLTLRAKICPLMRDGQKCTLVEHRGTSPDVQQGRGPSDWFWTFPAGNCFEPTATREKPEQEIAAAIFDCEDGTGQDREHDFYVVVLRAAKNWKGQGDWMQGLLLLRAEGEAELYRRVAKLDLWCNVQWGPIWLEGMHKYDIPWPDWFDDLPRKTITLI